MLLWRLCLGSALVIALVGLFALDAWIGETAPVLWLLALLLGLRSVWELRQLLASRFSPNLPLVSVCVLAVVSANWLSAITLPSPPGRGAGGEGSVDWRPPSPPTPLPGGAGGNEARGLGTNQAAGRLASTREGSSLAGRLGMPLLAFALSLVVLFATALTRYGAPGKNVENLGSEILILSYVGIFISFTVQLRWIHPKVLHYIPLASLLVAVKCGDTCAYFAGRYLGKRKLSPLISPGKTWEGAIAGVCGAALGSWLWLTFGVLGLTNAAPGPWYWSILYGALLGIVGIIGDLAESLIKRDVGAKDSARLLPGLGGVLDLLDSILFTAPVAYLLWLVLPLV